jgi:MFS family permease
MSFCQLSVDVWQELWAICQQFDRYSAISIAKTLVAPGKNNMLRSLNRPDILIVTLAAAGILMVTMGARQSLGLFIAPIGRNDRAGHCHHQPGAGHRAIHLGRHPAGGRCRRRPLRPACVLIGGLLLLALGSAITPFMGTGFGLIVSLGLLSAMGSGAGSFSVLIGAAAQRLPLEARGSASGVINAGGSFGQFVFAPILQKLIQTVGWMGAMWAMALMTLAALPLVGKLTRPVRGPGQAYPRRQRSAKGRSARR